MFNYDFTRNLNHDFGFYQYLTVFFQRTLIVLALLYLCLTIIFTKLLCFLDPRFLNDRMPLLLIELAVIPIFTKIGLILSPPHDPSYVILNFRTSFEY